MKEAFLRRRDTITVAGWNRRMRSRCGRWGNASYYALPQPPGDTCSSLEKEKNKNHKQTNSNFEERKKYTKEKDVVDGEMLHMHCLSHLETLAPV